MIIRIVAALCLAASAAAPAQTGTHPIADSIYYNGRVITVDDDESVMEAFAVKGDRFLAVGSYDDLKGMIGPGTRSVDLRGHAVVPGMIDNHNHQYHVALLTLRGVDMQNVPSLAEMLNRLKQAAATAAPDQVIYTTMGWNSADFPEKRAPTRQDLDQAVPDHPVVVYFNRGRLHVNTRALQLFGIINYGMTRNINTLENIVVGKDDKGEPDGLISGQSAAILKFSARVVPPPTLDEKMDILERIQVQQHAMGLTGIRDLQLHPDVMRAYYELWLQKRLTMRVSMGIELNAGEEDRLDQMLGPWGAGSGFGDEWLRLDGIAEYNPGDQMREPYANRPGEIGELRLPEADFREAILKMNRYGWRPSLHVDGDRTLDLVLDAYEAADRERSIRNRRWIVEHIPVVHPDQMQRMQRLGVMVSAQFQPYARARNMIREWGKERTERAVPMRELLDHGLIVSGGSDWPGSPNNPLLNIYYYVTRDTLELGPVGLDQKISRQEAVRVMTLNNAWLTYEEEIKGSIEVGKLADFVILSADVLTIPEAQIRDIRPLATFTSGNRVYSSQDSPF